MSLFSLNRHRTLFHRSPILFGSFLGFAAAASAQINEEGEAKTGMPGTDVVIEGAILKTIESTSVSAQVAGVISAMKVKEGAVVKAGQEIGRIRDAAVRLQMEKSKVSIAIAERKQNNDIDRRLAAKNRAVAENEYRRAVDANTQVKDVYPINEIDRLKLLFDRADLESERAIYQQSMATLDKSLAEMEYQINLELAQRHQIQSPCDGVVVSLEKRIGEWVEPGTNLLKIVQIDMLRIEGFILAADATSDLLGATAEVTFENSTPPFQTTAKLGFISPDVNPLNSQVRVYLEVENQNGRLRPGLRPKAVIRRSP